MIFIIAFLAAITPGPDLLLLIRVALKNNIKEAFITMGGIISGSIIYLSILYFGLSSIVKNNITQILICLFGGLYLSYLAFKLLKNKIDHINLESNLQSGYKTGLIVNLSNPKAILFFVAMVGGYVDNNLLINILWMLMGSISGFILAILVASFLKRFINKDIFNVIDKICGVLFIFFAISLFINAIDKIDKVL